MSLLQQIIEKQHNEKLRLAARHAIVKLGVDRNVRDAYFYGLIFAAIANDEKIDEQERSRLEKIGESLTFVLVDIVEAIHDVLALDKNTKMKLIEECAHQLSQVEVAECFMTEFEDVWKIGGGSQDEFVSFKPVLIKWMGEDVKLAVEAKEKAAAEIEAKRLAEEAEARRKEDEDLERRRRIEAERKAEEVKQVSGEKFYQDVVNWLEKDVRYGHLPQEWKKTLREKYDASPLNGGFLSNGYSALIKEMKEILPNFDKFVEETAPFDDNVWKVAVFRMDDSFQYRPEYYMFMAACQALITLSHGEDFVSKYSGGPLLLMNADEEGTIETYEWVDRFCSIDHTSEHFLLKGKYIRCELGEFRWNKYHMDSLRAREIAKSFFREIVKQIELMFVDLV